MSAPERHEQTPPVGVKWHEYANVFPMLYGPALDALREDIRANSVREPIVFLGEYILDGRNRYQCARDLGIEYPRREFGSQESDGTDPLAFVISHNLTRRHLTESQRASAAARLANMPAHRQSKSANLPGNVSQASAAQMLNVSERSLRSAKAVQQSAPDIAPFVDDGSLSVSLASKVANLPQDVQDEIIETPPDERRGKALAFVQHNTGKNEWYTPAYIIEAAKSVLGEIELDPASSEIANKTVRALEYYTESHDALSLDWPLSKIWMNPPYSKGLVAPFIAKLCESVEAGSEAIVLVNNASETAWFQRLAAISTAVCFHKGRVRYATPEGDDSGAPLQGQAIFYCGPELQRFKDTFGELGVVLCRQP